MPYFEYGDARLHYIDLATASGSLPLIFIHGAGSSHISWALQLREFSSTNRVIALDLSGHGKSDDIPGEVSIDHDYPLELNALIQHLDLTSFVLIAHSLGGGVAMSYILGEFGPLPKAQVLVDTSPDLELSKLVPGLVKEAITDRLFLFKSRFFEDYTDTFKLKELEDRMRRENPGVLAKDLQACNQFNVTESVGKIQIPTFIIMGEHDDIISPSIGEELKNRLPFADLAIVRGAHHVPMIEEPDEFNRLLRKFISWVEENR